MGRAGVGGDYPRLSTPSTEHRDPRNPRQASDNTPGYVGCRPQKRSSGGRSTSMRFERRLRWCGPRAGSRLPGLAPTVLIDGAHNEEGFKGLADTLSSSEFPEDRWVLVVGVRGDRDVASLVAPLRGSGVPGRLPPRPTTTWRVDAAIGGRGRGEALGCTRNDGDPGCRRDRSCNCRGWSRKRASSWQGPCMSSVRPVMRSAWRTPLRRSTADSSPR